MPFLRAINAAGVFLTSVLATGTRDWLSTPSISALTVQAVNVTIDEDGNPTFGTPFTPTGTPVVSGYWIGIPFTAAEITGYATLVRLHDGDSNWSDTGDVIYTTAGGSGASVSATFTGPDEQAIIDGVVAGLAAVFPDGSEMLTSGEKTTLLAYETTLAAIKAKSDQLTFTSTNVHARIEAFSSAMQTLVEDLLDNVLTDATRGPGDLTAPPATQASIRDELQWLTHKSRDGGLASATTVTVKDSGGNVIGTATVTDNGTSVTLGQFA